MNVEYAIHSRVDGMYQVIRYIKCEFIEDDLMHKLTLQPSKTEAEEWLRLHLKLRPEEMDWLNEKPDMEDDE